MKKTLLLCFIHGFKGGENTFGDGYQFTLHLRDSVAKQLPKIDVKVLVYPKYETRGDLAECVGRFRDWLLEKVIDIEVEAGTSSPTVDPSVRTILIGHSMGGIVAAETVIRLTSDKPIHPDTDGKDLPADLHNHYNTASSALAQINNFWGAGKPASPAAGAAGAKAPIAALPAPETAAAASAPAQGGGWGKWGKVAMFAGAGAAIAATSAAAYVNRDNISQGFGWVSSHLEFVGCLARAEDLKRRLAHVVRASEELDFGFANLYTRLGKAAGSKKVAGVAGTVFGSQRTFCNLPNRSSAGNWTEAINDKASDETVAHMTMFEPQNNPAYKILLNDASNYIVTWTKNDWYASSAEAQASIEGDPMMT
ncbi:unnamed protein product [Parascedosporium putredinis]|uniref:DUF676 domain-containing protein n=1 Tax=Parascedosporium putredinis TaxID=1442378 RepID=A0A9P1H982_9PEZI|nr:unnamed protein product [Parascedosporium putredinis]CAI8000702.1 unnamed protein product [Parascedosporium putredinis]